MHGQSGAVNPAAAGTKAAAHYRLEAGAGQSVEVRLCLTDAPSSTCPLAAFDKTLEQYVRDETRIAEKKKKVGELLLILTI